MVKDDSRRVGFVIAGVQKAATSTLYAMLAEHPQIASAKAKELHFFDRDRRDWTHPDYRPYHRKIRWADGTVIAGEATPRYIFWPGALDRLAAYNPSMRLIISFRDPIERAFSHWSMIKARDSNEPDFTTAIRAYAYDRAPRTAAEVGQPARNFIGRGFYGEQLARALALFPREQLLLLDYHQIFRDLDASMATMTDFLEVDRFGQLPAEVRKREQPTELSGTPPSASDMTTLANLYEKDLQHFGELSGFDVTQWPTGRVITGALDPAELATTLATKSGLIATS